MANRTAILLTLLCFSAGAQLRAQYPTFTVSDTSLCQGETVTFFNGLPDLHGYGYQWDFGDGYTDTTHGDASHFYPQSGNYQASLNMTGDSFIYILRSIKIHSMIGWVDAFDWKVDPYIKIKGCENSQSNVTTNYRKDVDLPQTFHLNQVMGLQCYTIEIWDHDAGIDDKCANISIQIPGATATVAGTNGNNNSANITYTIEAIPISAYQQMMTVLPGPMVPVIQVMGGDTICAGEMATLVTATDQGASIQWLKNNQPIPNAVGDTLVVNEAGIYTAKAIHPTGGCSPTSLPRAIVVNTVPTPALTTAQANFCYGDSTLLQINGLSASLSYQYEWYKDNLLLAVFQGSPASVPDFWVDNTGLYHVTITSPNGCSGISSPMQITEIFPPVPSISSDITAYCAGDTFATIQVAGLLNGTNYQFEWYRDSSLVNAYASSQAQNHQYPAPSGGNYQLIVTEPHSCAGTSGSVEIIEVLPYTATLTGGSTVCSGDTLWVQANSGAGLQYQWFQDSIALPNMNAQSLGVTIAGNYWVRVTDLANCGGDSSANHIVNVIPGAIPPSLQLVGDTNLICPGSRVLLRAEVDSSQSYQWWQNGQLMSPQPGDSLWVDSTSSYQLHTQNSWACSAVSPRLSLETIAPASLLLTGPAEFCAGADTLQIQVLAQHYSSIHWMLEGALLGQGSSWTPTDSGNYEVIVASAVGCPDEILMQAIIVHELPDPMIDRVGEELVALPGYQYRWFDDFGNNWGNQQRWFPSESGTFLLEVTNTYGCSATSEPFEMWLTGIADVPRVAFSLFPNPHAGIFQLSLPEALPGNTQIRIVDLQGRMIYQEKRANGMAMGIHTLTIPSVPEGLYLLWLENESKAPGSFRMMVRR